MSVILRVACVELGEPRTLVGKLVKTTTHQEDLRMLTTPSTHRCKVLSLKSTLSSDSPVFVCSSFISCPVRQQRMRIWKFTWIHQKIAPCCFNLRGYHGNQWLQAQVPLQESVMSKVNKKNWYILLYNLKPFVERRSHLTSCCSVVIHIWKNMNKKPQHHWCSVCSCGWHKTYEHILYQFQFQFTRTAEWEGLVML